MSALQEQAVRLIDGLSDDNVSFLIEIIHRLMPERKMDIDENIRAFHRLGEARVEIRQYLPADFDPDTELAEARAERYDNFD